MRPFFALLILSLSLSRAAAQPAPVTAPPPPAHPWSVGLRSGYTTIPNFVLGGLFDLYKPVNGYFIEAVGGRKMKAFTLYTSLSVTRAGADTGAWWRGDPKIPNNVVIDVTFLGFEALFDWEVRFHRQFALHFGAGVGFGFLFGTIASQDCVLDVTRTRCQQPAPGAPTRDRIAEDAWPIYPVLHLVAGAHIDLAYGLSVRIDFDFRNAFGFGIGLLYAI